MTPSPPGPHPAALASTLAFASLLVSGPWTTFDLVALPVGFGVALAATVARDERPRVVWGLLALAVSTVHAHAGLHGIGTTHALAMMALAFPLASRAGWQGLGLALVPSVVLALIAVQDREDGLRLAMGALMGGVAGLAMGRNQQRTLTTVEAANRELAKSKALLETEVKQRSYAERELSRAYAAALEGARVKTAFLANMSHELRTPMNAVVGLTDLLLSDDRLSEDQRENLTLIRDSGGGLLVLLNDLLDLSKIEAGAVELDTIDFDAVDVADRALRLLEPRAKQKGIGFVLDVDGAVPRSLAGDPLRLNQVLTNLAGNAIKFTEKGEVRVTLRWAEPYLEVEVKDTGLGMTPEQQARLFKPFVQADASTTRRFGGTGLGLAIVKRLCELHQGTIELHSAPGQGSTFTANLQYAKGSGKARPSQPAPTQASFNGLRVLVAEDNRINQVVARRLLERLGVAPTVVSNGLEAVEAVTGGDWPVVLMDIQMPELDGLEASRRIRASGGKQPIIIALSASAMEEDRKAALEAGVDDYLAKPVTLEGLSAALQRVCQPPQEPEAPAPTLTDPAR